MEWVRRDARWGQTHYLALDERSGRGGVSGRRNSSRHDRRPHEKVRQDYRAPGMTAARSPDT